MGSIIYSSDIKIGEYVSARICMQETAKYTSGNSTKISVWVEAWRTNTGYTTYGEGTLSVSLDNSTWYSSDILLSQKVTYQSYTMIGGKKEFTAAHNANGTKTVVIYAKSSASIANLTFSTVSRSFKLIPNPVYSLSISAGTGSAVTVNRTASDSGLTGRIYDGSGLCYGDKLAITFTASPNYTIAQHTVNGLAFTSGNTHTVSKNVTVVSTANPLKSAVGATDASIGSVSAITVTKYDPAYTHTLEYSFGDLSGYITSSGEVSASPSRFSEASVPFALPSEFYTQLPAATAGVCTITCTTYNGDVSLGSTACTFIASTSYALCSPIIQASVIDTNETTVALTGDNSVLIRYKSAALCTLSATPRCSADISVLKIGDSTVEGASNSGTITGTKAFANVETPSFSFLAVDTRAYTASAAVTPTTVAYIPLTCNPLISRPSPTGSAIVMQFSGNIYRGSFGACSNALTLQYRYKTPNDASYSSWQTVDPALIEYGTAAYQSDGMLSLGNDFDYLSDYTFQIRASDGGTVNSVKYELSSVTKTVTVSKGTPVFDWGENDFEFHVPVKISDGGLQLGNTIITEAQLQQLQSLLEADEDTNKSSAELMTGTGTCGDFSCPITYFKSNSAALVFFSSGYNNSTSGTASAEITLPRELWDFTGGQAGNGYMWATGNPSACITLQPDTNTASAGYGLRVKIMGQNVMPVTWAAGKAFYGWCWLTYEGTSLPSGSDTPGSLTAVGLWRTLTLQSGFTSEYARWRTVNFGTSVQIQLKNIQGPSSLTFPANICKLPDEALPADTTYRGISCGTGTNYSRYEISPWTGYVQWYNEYPSYGSGHWLDVQCIYPI